MKYFANYEADAVIRESDTGQRYKKTIEYLFERRVSSDDEEAWGIPSYGIYNELKPITKEEYDGFGITWDWDPRTGKRRELHPTEEPQPAEEPSTSGIKKDDLIREIEDLIEQMKEKE